MKKIILSVILSLVSFNALAIQLICESPQKSTSGKSITVYRFDSNQGTMERFAYIQSRNSYALFGQLDNLVFSDDLYRTFPLKRVVIAKAGNKEILNATWSNGSLVFRAEISGEGSQVFTCKWKN